MRQSASSSPFSVYGRFASIRYAIRGIRTMIQSQHNTWIHVAATIIVVSAGAIVGLSLGEWCWITIAIMTVWTAEALNTSLELLTDMVSPDFHPLAGKVKDVAAGAVLISALGAVVIGLLVFVPHVIG